MCYAVSEHLVGNMLNAEEIDGDKDVTPSSIIKNIGKLSQSPPV